jgi:signal transduction histidine kinase
VSRIDLPVQVQVPDERFHAGLEASAYFVVAEALTNVVKHARASRVEIHVALAGETLHLEVRDDGVGGAEVEAGSGLVGLKDRAAAAGGQLSVESPPGQGTVIAATLPAGGGSNDGSSSGASE